MTFFTTLFAGLIGDLVFCSKFRLFVGSKAFLLLDPYTALVFFTFFLFWLFADLPAALVGFDLSENTDMVETGLNFFFDLPS